MSENEHDTHRSDDELIFAKEEDSSVSSPALRGFKILIVDDEEEVHNITRVVLDGYLLDGRHLDFMGAYSGKEARKVIQENPDIAIILLDVVMEDDHAGLDVVRYIRDELCNKIVRIVLRTGQPGQAPEQEVVKRYDINDYKEKTELTVQKLHTTVTAALRAYRDILTIEQNRSGLQKIVSLTSSLLELREPRVFADGLLEAYQGFLPRNGHPHKKEGTCFVARHSDGQLDIIAAAGKHRDAVGERADKALLGDVAGHCQECISSKKNIVTPEGYFGYYATSDGNEHVVYAKLNMPLTEVETNLIEVFSSSAGVAFENLQLNEEIINTQKEIVIMLGGVVESRSKETANHVLRVAEYAHTLGLLLGLDEGEAVLLRMAAPMHDVGKIGIPDMILNKPAALTAEEYDVMKTHTLIGHEILNKSNREILRTAALIALEHHEKWNGKGYPRNIRGEEIHIFGRIVGLTDVFDALGHDRVYKSAWSLDEILELIRQQKGEHFDPDLVDLLLNNMDRFVAIRDTYTD